MSISCCDKPVIKAFRIAKSITNSWHPHHQNFVDHKHFLTKYQLSVFLCLLFAEKIKFLIGQSTKIIIVKTGFEELKKRVNKIWLKK